MNEVLLKYEALDTFLQKQALEFMDYLLSMKNKVKPVNMSDYKQKILKVSTWPEEDIEIFNKNRKLFNQWNIAEF
jgi:hypothetical protein